MGCSSCGTHTRTGRRKDAESADRYNHTEASWEARQTANYKIAQSLLWEAEYQLLRNSLGLSRLLDKNNWPSTRPSISVFAAFNIRGNLKVSWDSPYPLCFLPPDFRLENTTGFTNQFFREGFYDTEPYGTYGTSRPAAELMWFRKVPLAWHIERDHPAVRCIIYAIHSKYQQILRDIGRDIEVTKTTRFEFLRDDENQVEWTLA